MTKPNTAITLIQLSKNAKQYKREHPEVTQHQALDIIARENGFNNFHHAQKVLTRKEAETCQQLPELPEACRAVLQRMIQFGEEQVAEAARMGMSNSKLYELGEDVKAAWQVLDKLGGKVQDAPPPEDPHHVDFLPGERIRVVLDGQKNGLIFFSDTQAREDFAALLDEMALKAGYPDEAEMCMELRDLALEDVRYLQIDEDWLMRTLRQCGELRLERGFEGQQYNFDPSDIQRIQALMAQFELQASTLLGH